MKEKAHSGHKAQCVSPLRINRNLARQVDCLYLCSAEETNHLLQTPFSPERKQFCWVIKALVKLEQHLPSWNITDPCLEQSLRETLVSMEMAIRRPSRILATSTRSH